MMRWYAAQAAHMLVAVAVTAAVYILCALAGAWWSGVAAMCWTFWTRGVLTALALLLAAPYLCLQVTPQSRLHTI
jgi:hypothetical protein